MPVERDLYRVLGVAADATRDDIVHAYRRLAQASHPDTRPGDAGAAGRFVDVSAAYQVLADPVRRADYDRTRNARAQSRPPRPSARPRDDLTVSSRSVPWSAAPGWVGPLAEPLLRVGPVHVSPPDPITPSGAVPPLYFADAVERVRQLVVWLHDGWTW